MWRWFSPDAWYVQSTHQLVNEPTPMHPRFGTGASWGGRKQRRQRRLYADVVRGREH